MSPEQGAPRVAIRTVGCRLNQAESAQIAAAFQAAGYVMVPPSDPCDVFIVHSCTITGNAESDSSRLARSATRRLPRPVVVMAGCAVEVGHDAVAERSQADLVVGQADKFDLPTLLAARFGLPSVHPAGSGDAAPLPFFTSTRAIVRVQDGCRFGCSYCIVPQTRSTLWSRPLDETIEEVRRLGEAGYQEVVITGANLGCYRDEQHSLVDLLSALVTETDVARIRLSSIETSTITDALIDFMARTQRMCRYLHVPVQSGDDEVLAAMKRRYRVADFRAVIEQANAAMPALGIGTDIITGFPGESEAAFEHTRELVETLPFSNLHVFPFSLRPGTAAAGLSGSVDPGVARERARELIALGERKRSAYAQRFIGQDVTVLIEKTDASAGYGWTSEYLPARITGSHVAEHQLVTFQPTAWQDDRLVC